MSEQQQVITMANSAPHSPTKRNDWIRAFCTTWDELVNGSADLVDLANWADALYRTHWHLDPREVARAAFVEAELCG